MSLVLLDTHAFIWWVDGGPLPNKVIQELTAAMMANKLAVSPISLWEIGLLSSRGHYQFHPTFEIWCRNAMRQSGANVLPLSTAAALGASTLPGNFHKDPADRLLVASAMDVGATLVTRDAKIITWAAQTRALNVLAC